MLVTGNICCSQLFDVVKLFVLLNGRKNRIQMNSCLLARPTECQLDKSCHAPAEKLFGWQAREKQLDD